MQRRHDPRKKDLRFTSGFAELPPGPAKLVSQPRVSIRKTFAQFFFLCTSVLHEKNNNLRNHSQKSFRAKLPYSAFAKLKFCAIPQFRKKQTVGDSVCFL